MFDTTPPADLNITYTGVTIPELIMKDGVVVKLRDPVEGSAGLVDVIPSPFDMEAPVNQWPKRLTDSKFVFDDTIKRYVVERLWWARDLQGNVGVFVQKYKIQNNSKPSFVSFPENRRVNQLVELNPYLNYVHDIHHFSREQGHHDLTNEAVKMTPLPNV